MQSIVFANSSNTTIDSLGYTYNAAGELSSQSDDGTVTDTYTYDASGQVTSDSSSDYSYDLNGNPNGGNITVGASNEIVSDANWAYSYDNAGNLIQKTGLSTGADPNTIWVYGYDNANDLTTVCEYANGAISTGNLEVSVNYSYDVFGNRIAQSVWTGSPGGTVTPTVTNYALDGWDPAKAGAAGASGFDVWAEINGGSLTTRYINGDILNQVFARVSSTEGTAWLLTNPQQSVVDVTNGSGVLQDKVHYDAYGNMTVTAEAGGGSLAVGSVTYTGQRNDSAIGMYDMRGREYDPSIQQYLQQDPLEFTAGDSNLRRYVNNAPTNLTDPSGLTPDERPGFWGWFGAAVRTAQTLSNPVSFIYNATSNPDSVVRDLNTVTGGRFSQAPGVAASPNDAYSKMVKALTSKPSLIEDLIPIYGPVRGMMYNVDQGDYWAATC